VSSSGDRAVTDGTRSRRGRVGDVAHRSARGCRDMSTYRSARALDGLTHCREAADDPTSDAQDCTTDRPLRVGGSPKLLGEDPPAVPLGSSRSRDCDRRGDGLGRRDTCGRGRSVRWTRGSGPVDDVRLGCSRGRSDGRSRFGAVRLRTQGPLQRIELREDVLERASTGRRAVRRSLHRPHTPCGSADGAAPRRLGRTRPPKGSDATLRLRDALRRELTRRQP
jgi:hypothetical protein